ncbi:hypothetical protein SEPCBS119000_002090 [Sporothrix epigloea]|uniref:Cryptic loci regulator 2 N-terminal domain-containing protein n=1 Tax=Sporothrix epigloea TaxID=1892477 RepID=A0ABP0DEA7_9PEZI
MSSKPTVKPAAGRMMKSGPLGSTPMGKTAFYSSVSAGKPKTSAASLGSTSAATSGAGNGSNSNSNSNSHNAPLQKYREILIARSDGVGYTTQQLNDASRSAQPVGDALGDSHEFVRSWTAKLGKAIKYNLGSAAAGTDPNNYLVRFPQGYSLHVRPGKTKDRDGPLVFGHPLGPLAAFRSPAELALHILWLMSDSVERTDCSCRLCVRMVSEATAAATPAKTLSWAPTVTPVPVPVIPTTALPATAPVSTPSATSTGPTPAAPATVTPVPPPAPIPAPSAAATHPSSLSASVGGSSALFRPWELVWYQRFVQAQRGTWRLGIVLQVFPDGSSSQAYPPSAMPSPRGTVRVALLGINGLHPPEITQETSTLRPFLSFSVPAMRDGFQNATYDQINWQALAWEAQQYQMQQQQQQAPQQAQHVRHDASALDLEASKSIANQINACFSVFNPLPRTSHVQRTYGGLFLGAEQVLIGDAIRVDAHESMDLDDNATNSVQVMRVSTIATGNSGLRFFGDTYCLATTKPGQQLPPSSAPPGEVFAEELSERNHHRQPGTPMWYWRLCQSNCSREEHEVHGRFYASTRLAANLQNSEFLQRVAQHQSTTFLSAEGSNMMASALNRRQQVAGFTYQGQRANRAATIGQAIGVQLPPLDGTREEY